MQELELLQNTPLFAGISAPELKELLSWLAPVRRRYHKGEIVLMAGYPAREIGVVVEGLVQGAKPTGDGRQLAVGQFGPGGVFGDVLASGRRESPVTLTALCDTQRAWCRTCCGSSATNTSSWTGVWTFCC